MLFALLLPDHAGARLLGRIADGDELALRAAYDLYAGRVFASANRVLATVGEAEEVVQETFLEVWRRARSFDSSRGSAASWVLSIGRNRAIDRLRMRASRHRTLEELRRGEGPVETPTPEHQAEQSEIRKRMAAALDILPPDQRAVVELAYFDGLSQSEIAARTGHPLGTIKGRARAALEKLAEHLAKGAA